MEHIVWREKKAVNSALKLGNSPELETTIARCIEDIKNYGELEVKQFEELLTYTTKTANITLPTKLEENKASKEAKTLTPKRLFKGTFNTEALRRALEEEEYVWYEEITKKDKGFRKKTYEIFNFMDGKRTVYEITKAVSAEYGETDVEHVLKFIHDLEKTKFVSFK